MAAPRHGSEVSETGTSGRVQSGHNPEPYDERGKGGKPCAAAKRPKREQTKRDQVTKVVGFICIGKGRWGKSSPAAGLEKFRVGVEVGAEGCWENLAARHLSCLSLTSINPITNGPGAQYSHPGKLPYIELRSLDAGLELLCHNLLHRSGLPSSALEEHDVSILCHSFSNRWQPGTGPSYYKGLDRISSSLGVRPS